MAKDDFKKKDRFWAYYKEICVEDEEDLRKACNVADLRNWEEFKVKLEYPEILASIFSKTFEAIIKKLEVFEKDNSMFNINIANTLNIGYTTSENDDDEKEGNFMVYIKDNLGGKPLASLEHNESNMTAKECVTQWCQSHIVDENIGILNEIAVKALSMLKDIDIILPTSDFIWPLFCTLYSNIISQAIQMRKETNQFKYEINVFSCFYLIVQEAEDDNVDIIIRPSILSKLALKNDSIASSKYED